mmetsp:Transcript_25218/g.45642  ORF Transcript_25218/g.45642 Transcript_25218/m.45642 type:complete len:91 (+) Transcript_25218:132-404(+)
MRNSRRGGVAAGSGEMREAVQLRQADPLRGLESQWAVTRQVAHPEDAVGEAMQALEKEGGLRALGVEDRVPEAEEMPTTADLGSNGRRVA